MSDNMNESASNVWESVYSAGRQHNRFPWDAVVTFLVNAQAFLGREKLRVVEVGCGTGINLAAAQELGCEVYGIDISATAIDIASRRLGTRVNDTVLVGDFSRLPWADSTFDVAIDRASLTTSSPIIMRAAIRELHRCLGEESLFFFNPYSTQHAASRFALPTQFKGVLHVRQAPEGYLADLGDVSFVSPDALEDVLPPDDWDILSARELTSVERHSSEWRPQIEQVEAELRVVARKRSVGTEPPKDMKLTGPPTRDTGA